MPWGIILPILKKILVSMEPALKAEALAELKVLEVGEANQPFLLGLIQEVEKLVAAV